MGLEQDIVDTFRRLPPDRQREVLDFAEFLERRSRPASTFDSSEPPIVRRPPAELAGKAHIKGDIVAPAFDESEWDGTD